VLKNNGHTLQVDFKYDPTKERNILSGGNLKADNKFYLHQMHFHFTSEHTVKGGRYELELHLVHVNTDPNERNLEIPENKLAVVGILFEPGEENKFLKEILKEIKNVTKKDTNTTIRGLLHPTYALPKGYDTYYTYKGSLTTPPCDETVTWHVLTQTATATPAQLQKFRDVMGANYRPIQDSKNIVLKTNKAPEDKTSSYHGSAGVINTNLGLIVALIAAVLTLNQ